MDRDRGVLEATGIIAKDFEGDDASEECQDMAQIYARFGMVKPIVANEAPHCELWARLDAGSPKNADSLATTHVKSADSIVQLKTGGPKMTVRGMENIDGTLKVWRDWLEKGKRYKATYPITALKLGE